MTIVTFNEKVYATVKNIPCGKVATYGQVALMSGKRGAARAVGNALHVNPEQIGRASCRERVCLSV